MNKWPPRSVEQSLAIVEAAFGKPHDVLEVYTDVHQKRIYSAIRSGTRFYAYAHCCDIRFDDFEYLLQQSHTTPAMEDVAMEFLLSRSTAFSLIARRGGRFKNQTILHRVAAHGKLSLIRRILDAVDQTKITVVSSRRCQSILLSKDSRGFTPLHVAAEHGQCEAVRLFCSLLPPEFLRCVRTAQQFSLLHVASMGGSLEVCQYIQHSVGPFDFNDDSPKHNYTPLRLAIKRYVASPNHPGYSKLKAEEAIKWLFEMSNHTNRTLAIHFVCRLGSLELFSSIQELCVGITDFQFPPASALLAYNWTSVELANHMDPALKHFTETHLSNLTHTAASRMAPEFFLMLLDFAGEVLMSFFFLQSKG